MSDDEIEQVIDYVIFLSIRGETELALIDEGAISDENDPEALSAETWPGTSAESVFNKWKTAQTQVVNPPIPRTPADPREHPPRPRAVPGQDARRSWTAPAATGRRPWATARAS